VKKKLANLDLKIQIGLVVIGLLAAGFGGRMFLVAPQGAKAAKIDQQIQDVEAQITLLKAESQRAEQPQAIKVADLFRLAKAMPDREDMPGIILTISQVARSSGIHFDTIEPQDIAPAPVGSFRVRKIHLTFNGDFYALSDFLYRLRNLVTVHDGRLDANGRLFTVQTVTFNLGQAAFPSIAADVMVNAYIYGTGPAVAAPPATTTTDASGAPAAPDTTVTPPGATAVGAP
jgi:Tfp pilus assembly protein PilO